MVWIQGTLLERCCLKNSFSEFGEMPTEFSELFFSPKNELKMEDMNGLAKEGGYRGGCGWSG